MKTSADQIIKLIEENKLPFKTFIDIINIYNGKITLSVSKEDKVRLIEWLKENRGNFKSNRVK